jgi:DeoR/GlpR family transcriptional regulator of sugar metabolism
MSKHPLPTLTAERRAAIARIVTQSGVTRAADLAARFDVNAATIRRDLKALEAEGKLQRVHGGAVAVEKTAPDSTSSTQETRIGQVVAEMIAAGETVFLGPGRLTLAVARCLAARSRLTIITNGLEVAHWVAANTSHTLIVTGGQAEGRDLGLAGELAKAALSSLRAAHVILELDGISAVGGLTDDDLSQAEIARQLLDLGSQVVVLAPAERVGQAAAAYIAPVSEADVIVTAREAPSPFLWDLSESGVRVVLA